MKEWIARLFQDEQLLRMGHHQRKSDLNLGLGWIYYGLARSMRPKTIVVIGSYRGFAPLVFGKALLDNEEGGEVVFIDPSLVDDFWTDAAAVRAYFARHQVTNIRHFLMTTQDFTRSSSYGELAPVGMVFVDGYHSEEQARFDFEAFEEQLSPGGVALFHDTADQRVSKMYGPGRTYQRTVKAYVDSLKDNPGLQVLDVPFGDGVTIVRKVEAAAASC